MDSSAVSYDGAVEDQERQVDQEPEQNGQIAGDRLLKTLGIDPEKWTVGDRRMAFVGIVICVGIVTIAVCGYIFGWAWTGLTEPSITHPKLRTFWDWLNLLIVPIVLALGGYLFTRSESRRTKEDAERQRAVDREIADERRQDDTLQAYLDGMSQLLTDKERPLQTAQLGDSLSTVATARTLTMLHRLDGDRKGRALRFLYESSLITKDRLIVNLEQSNLREANLLRANLLRAYLRGTDLSEAELFRAGLSGADLSEADLSGTDLSEADLREARGITNDELDQQARSLRGATMPNGQKYEEWRKDREKRQQDE